MTVKGQATLDAANKRKAEEAKAKAGPVLTHPTELNEAVLLTMTKASGYEEPKSLAQLEHIVETNGVKGAEFWRRAAYALLAIKDHKLWKEVKNAEGQQVYASFTDYAEQRFGFKKTYAYDLAKAAQREALALASGEEVAATEGESRAAAKAGREQKAVSPADMVAMLETAWTRWENRSGDLRDRLANQQAVDDFDAMMSQMTDAWEQFRLEWKDAEEISADAETNDDLPPGHDDDATV